MTLWRIVSERRRESAFTGEGARLFGGRWNSQGRPVIYAAESVSLALLEVLVHVSAADFPVPQRLCRIELDSALCEICEPAKVSRHWRSVPFPTALQQFGDEWLQQSRSAALKVRSTIVPQEWNVLINPLHPAFPQVRCSLDEPVQIDPRLLRQPRNE